MVGMSNNKPWYASKETCIGQYYNDNDGVGNIYFNKELNEYAFVMWRYNIPTLEFKLKDGIIIEEGEEWRLK
jgi:hypothetical protein